NWQVLVKAAFTSLRFCCSEMASSNLHFKDAASSQAESSLTCLLASSSCFVAFCSSKPRASAWPAASSCNCLTVSISRCLQGVRAQTTIRY
uniref:Uncharacterized protein n=1 Tax=Anser cygnoides TaxID=8845 RepID=A0A8B9ING3_ANSCY